MVLSLSKQDVKRIAIRAQGLDHNRVATSKANDACKCPKVVTIGDIRRSILAMGLLQIDAVNVCVRSHYMPLFSRLGIYHRELLDRLAYKEEEIFETWAHAACFVQLSVISFFVKEWPNRSLDRWWKNSKKTALIIWKTFYHRLQVGGS